MSEKMKNKPKLRFPEFANSGEWEEKTIGDVSTIYGRIGYRGYTVNDIVEKNKGAIALSPSNFIENSINTKNSTYISWFKYEESPEIMIENGDILFVKTGSTYGKTVFVKNLNEKATINPQIVVFKNITINNSFLNYIVLNSSIKKQVAEIVVGGAIPTISQKALAKMKFMLPTKQEQQKIADCLSSVDSLISAQSQKVELLKEHKKALMQQLFPREGESVPRLRFPEFLDDGEWEEKNGNDIFQQISNKEHNSNLPILAITQEYGAIPRTIIDYHVSVMDKSIESYKVVEIGDFIISLRSFQGGIEYSQYKGICSPAYIILRKKIDLENNFFKFYFKTQKFIQQLNRNLEGIRDGKMVSYKQFSELFLPMPSIDEQQKIADCLSSLDKLITSLTKKVELLKEHKKGLMQQLFPSNDKASI